MISQGVVFVPIQYRLGTLGLIGDGTTEFSGNVALYDMAAAVRWVHEYIEFFGGDPSKITVMGHGSGATSAIHLSLSDEIDKDIIVGAVAMSGSAYTKYQIDDIPEQSVREIAQINGCGAAKNEVEIVKCLRKIDAVELVRRDSAVQLERLQGRAVMRAMTGMVGWAPAIERSYDERALPSLLTAKPAENLRRGRSGGVPLLTGVTKDETVNGIVLKEIEQVFRSASEFLGSVSDALHLEEIFPKPPMGNVDLLGIGNLKLTQFFFLLKA